MKTLASIATAAVMAIAGVLAFPVSAQADGFCTITDFSPRTVVVGLSPITKTFNVSTAGCIREAWTVESDEFFAYDEAPQETFYPYSNSQAGAHDVIATAYNADYDESEISWSNAFFLKRRASWTAFNAGPEPVKKGRTITIKGKLLRANWDTDSYGRYTGQRVSLQFRTPTGSYATVRTVTTNSDGWISTKVTANRTGAWRLAYYGNSLTGPATSAGDGVKVY